MRVVAVVDSNRTRAEGIVARVGVERCDPPYPVAPSQVGSSTRVVFLHASDDGQKEWRDFIDMCVGVYLVLYSGGNSFTKAYLDKDNMPIRDLDQESWCFLLERNRIDEHGEAVRGWDPKGFVDAIVERDETDHERLLTILTRFDRVLEGKLNLLYDCLEACYGSEFAERLGTLETEMVTVKKQGWKTVFDALQAEAGEDLKQFLAAWGHLKESGHLGLEEKLKRLKALRDVLLGE